jgi:hypothetical protein
MGTKKTRAIVLLAAGVVIVIVSVAADSIGLGAFPGFGYKQIIGTLVGIGVILVGLALLPKRVKVIE